MQVKKNKKRGFTLVEMLVVVAIIAILVAIIMPVVSASNVKAAAAANAANLRSVQGQIQTIRLLEPDKFDYITVQSSENGTLTFGQVTVPAPGARAIEIGGIKISENTPMRVQRNDDKIVCTYKGVTVEMFAQIAEEGITDGVISDKDGIMNEAEDLNDRFDEIIGQLGDIVDLDEETQKIIEDVADGLTDILNSVINGTDSSTALGVVDGLLGILGGLLG